MLLSKRGFFFPVNHLQDEDGGAVGSSAVYTGTSLPTIQRLRGGQGDEQLSL